MLILLLSDPLSWIDRPKKLREVLHRASLRQASGVPSGGPIAPGATLVFESGLEEPTPDDVVVVSDPGWWENRLDEVMSALDVAAMLTAGHPLETALDAAAHNAYDRELLKGAHYGANYDLPYLPADDRRSEKHDRR